ncbi:hypothetical protein SBOR_0221 [Sclerotinia borealis F-4128]|uniref:Uncharacterized protein n=1 Tax=Sclerotinia borealis (strain F-4128) TaxID=1432307 RepID=W9CXR7_SCLBF|nr:hypothetical protein SBOR_0221 [Sclerotinia borealis F-4128]
MPGSVSLILTARVRSWLDSLKYAIDMSFDDVAGNFGQSGNSILALLEKRHATLITVQPGFLRTCFLGNYGMVPESRIPENVFRNQWLDQLSRSVRLMLSWPDADIATLLGLPTTIDHRDEKSYLLINVPITIDRREASPTPRTKSELPTPLSIIF